MSEAKAQLSALVERVLAGEEIVIARAGKPVVKLVRYAPPPLGRRPGTLRGQIDIAEDFDELPPDLQLSFGMRDA